MPTPVSIDISPWYEHPTTPNRDGLAVSASRAPTYTPIQVSDFEDGTVDTGAGGSDAFPGGSYGSQYRGSPLPVFEGSQSGEWVGDCGHNGNTGFTNGGRYDFSPVLGKGDKVWIKFKAFLPIGYNYTGDPFLKFLRIRTNASGGGANEGYNDIYFEQIDTANGFYYIKEQDDVPKYSLNGHHPVLGVWETYEYHVAFDNVPAASAGTGRARLWKNDELIIDVDDVPTLNTATSEAAWIYFGSFWNGGAPLLLTSISGPIIVGNAITASPSGAGGTLASKIVNSLGQNYFIDSDATPSPAFEDGDTITDSITSETATLAKANQLMYIDDLIIATETPNLVDQSGNPFISSRHTAVNFD